MNWVANRLFPLGWQGFGLKSYRLCDKTYCFFSYESLPPLPDHEFQGDFRWLTPLEPHVLAAMERFWLPDEEQASITENIKKLTASVQDKGLRLPDSFITFMSNLEYQQRIPSCTACYFELYGEPKSCPVSRDNFVIRFLNDQQSVFTWYLYLSPNGDHSVVVSYPYFDMLSENEGEFSEQDYSEAVQNTFTCATSFEEFIFRFWLENSIWFALVDKHRALTETEESYLMHYKTGNAT